ncbi:Zinc transporter ZupT [bacterium HR40]|nr:Zinc transporter ZupT [bacterium HR40]
MIDSLQLALVFLAALATALATGLGALPFLFVREMRRRWLGVSNATAAGLMIAASLTLLVEGAQVSGLRTLLGLALGWMSIRWTHGLMDGREHLSIGSLAGADARKALLVVGVMTLHSFSEGVGVGVSFGGGKELGLFISSAIAFHNIPEGLAISLVLVPRGVSVWLAAWWSVFSSLPQPLMAVPAYLFVSWFAPFLPVGFGLAAGAMFWMTFTEIIPEARADLSRTGLALAIALSTIVTILFQETVLR